MKKLYAQRDIIGQGEHYYKHVRAMTSEDLRCKSDIAAELAHRDIVINSLVDALENCKAHAICNDVYTDRFAEMLESVLKNAKGES